MRQNAMWMGVAGLAAMLALAPSVLADIDLGEADDDTWVYVRAGDPGGDPVLRVWGNDGEDLNPTGYPGQQGTQDFYSHAFVQWDLADLPPGFRWEGATLTITGVEGSNYDALTDDVYVRGLSSPFDEDTWEYGVGTKPLDRGLIVGDDSGFAGEGDAIAFELPRNLPRQILERWRADRKIYLAITSPIDFDGDRKILRFASSEHLLHIGPTLVLKQGGGIIPTPGSLTLIGLGAAGLTARRRRRD